MKTLGHWLETDKIAQLWTLSWLDLLASHVFCEDQIAGRSNPGSPMLNRFNLYALFFYKIDQPQESSIIRPKVSVFIHT